MNIWRDKYGYCTLYPTDKGSLTYYVKQKNEFWTSQLRNLKTHSHQKREPNN